MTPEYVKRVRDLWTTMVLTSTLGLNDRDRSRQQFDLALAELVAYVEELKLRQEQRCIAHAAVEVQSGDCPICDLEAAENKVRELTTMLTRLRQWDIIAGGGDREFTADAPFWRDELDRVLAARGVGNGPVAGRFVLLHDEEGEQAYITSWDTWEECAAAFPIEGDAYLLDQSTGRRWDRHSKYEWEAAAT